MSISYRVGFLGDNGLTRDELVAVLKATSARSVTEMVGDEPTHLSLENGALDDFPADPGIDSLYRKLFAKTGSVRSDVASAAELCVLVPGEVDRAYKIARRIPGVEGFSVKSLRTATAELVGHCEENGIDCTEVQLVMERAEELNVGMIFGYRNA